MSDEAVVKQVMSGLVSEMFGAADGLDDSVKPVIARVLSDPNVTEVLAPTAVRRQALQLQLTAARLLDEADRLEFRAKLRELAKATDEPGDAARLEEVRLVEAIEAAIQVERQAEDRVREADENHRQAAEAERDGQRGQLSASEEADLLHRTRAAADIAARRRAHAEGVKTHRESLERQLAAARQVVSERTAAEEAAYALVNNPPKAPTSTITALLDGFRRLMWGQELDKQGLAVVNGLVQDAAKRTGLARHLQAQAVEQRDKERANRAFERSMPAPGHPYRPANPTSPVFAVRPPS
ncbi:hypothetical protein [Streptomyces sp. B1-3]|uniref:hypothetical protein n=1 Tax=Streptomyces sp. B1-3 TaxID=3141453 RepID=UPI003D2B9358